MPVLGRRPTMIALSSGETLTVVSEAAPYTVPEFRGRTAGGTVFLTQKDIVPLGTRLVYSLYSPSTTPVPVLCQYKRSPRSPSFQVFPLHNAVDPYLLYNTVTERIHLLWWWNGWTPTPDLPKPPDDHYQAHSVPDPLTPPWLLSVVPKSLAAPFDPRASFWVAPIPEGYQYDYYAGVVMGESRVNGENRMPDSPGARLLQDLVARGLVESPGPDAAAFGAVPSTARDDWERRGGIVGAGEHLRLASARDTPEFVPNVGTNPYTREAEMAQLPGVGTILPESITWEDHLVIVNALKAHYDYANLGNATRVLMWASGFLRDGMTLTTVSRRFPRGETVDPGPKWPGIEETTTTSVLVLDFPRVIAAFPAVTNYRTTVNPDKIRYPYLDYPDIGTILVTDGFPVESATSHLKQQPAVDWVLSDPTEAAAQRLDMYRNHLDNRSF